MAAMVGCAVNPQHALPPQRHLPRRIEYPMRKRTLSEACRDIPGGGKLARKAKRLALWKARHEAKVDRTRRGVA